MASDYVCLTQHSMTWTPKKNWLTWTPICKWPLYVIVKMLEKIEWKTTFFLWYLERNSKYVTSWGMIYKLLSIIFFKKILYFSRTSQIDLPYKDGPLESWSERALNTWKMFLCILEHPWDAPRIPLCN